MTLPRGEKVQDVDSGVCVDSQLRTDDRAGHIFRMHHFEDPPFWVKVRKVGKPEFAGSEPGAEHEGNDELRCLRPPAIQGVELAQRVSQPVLVLDRTGSVCRVWS